MNAAMQQKTSELDLLSQEYRKVSFQIHQFEEAFLKQQKRNEPTSPSRDTSSAKAVEADLAYSKSLFSKLKFNYLELATKEKFIRDLMQEPPIEIEQEDIQELEVLNMDHKQALKKRKTETQARKEQIDYIIDNLAIGCQSIETEFGQTRQLLTDIRDLEAQIKELEGDENGEQKLTIQESQKVLNEQLASLETMNNEIELAQTQLNESRTSVEDLERELEKYQAIQRSEEAIAAEAVRLAQQKDPQIQELCQWYDEARHTMVELTGIQNFRTCPPHSIIIEYDRRGPTGQYTGLEINMQDDGKRGIKNAKSLRQTHPAT
ncbi:hypothetical protein BJ085DRAFT_34061 [Dimargaris cristalligena]|uniref:Kinetochore protein Sos7 coiled-coil domain-containing protein n=1 Tax=Dimargaris cristalligena TaxID=215637 RepID=A0A4P9ZRN2_9FUNG|nr:hypothetical protein BJ085DRAFT_34061 [Dimargaris cristalligena]|eukprot:RKP36067.1 hypothetical protein BJ085DRAFT_34061 [Dimargaris cristalligena]